MPKFVALYKISHNWRGLFEATGQVDPQGNMIVKSRGEQILPGQIFEIEEGEELNRLLELRACRPLNETEDALEWKREDQEKLR